MHLSDAGCSKDTGNDLARSILSVDSLDVSSRLVGIGHAMIRGLFVQRLFLEISLSYATNLLISSRTVLAGVLLGLWINFYAREYLLLCSGTGATREHVSSFPSHA